MSASDNRNYAILAEFKDARTIYLAAQKVREAGFTKWDALTPFPVHGLEHAMGLKASPVPYVALVSGLFGAAGGMVLEWWTSAVDYPLVIAAKPYFSWPAFVPVMFELGVLFAAFGAFLGSLYYARLPKWYDAVFYGEATARVSDDRFCIVVDAADPKFDVHTTQQFFRELEAVGIELIEEPRK